jgi:hypothetical protein
MRDSKYTSAFAYGLILGMLLVAAMRAVFNRGMP